MGGPVNCPCCTGSTPGGECCGSYDVGPNPCSWGGAYLPICFGLSGTEMSLWNTCIPWYIGGPCPDLSCPGCENAYFLVDSRTCVDPDCLEFTWDGASFSCCYTP